MTGLPPRCLKKYESVSEICQPRLGLHSQDGFEEGRKEQPQGKNLNKTRFRQKVEVNT